MYLSLSKSYSDSATPKVVLLLWLEQFAEAYSPDLKTAALTRRLLYVAMTRAQDELHLFSGGRRELVDGLTSSESFAIKQFRVPVRV